MKRQNEKKRGSNIDAHGGEGKGTPHVPLKRF